MIAELFPQKITFRNGLEVEFDLAGDLEIGPDLDYEFRRQGENYVRYATAYEIAMAEAGRIKVELEQVCAQVDVAARKNATASGSKLTEKMAEHTIKGSVEYLEKNDELLQAQKITGLLKSARDAMMHKKDSLVQLAYNKRQELASDPSMKAEYIKSGLS